MAKKKQLPVNVVQNSKNRKLSALKPTYNVVTTYTEVGPTCPTECWFHPKSIHTAMREELKLKACYTKKGPTNFLVSAKAFQDADFTQLGIDDVARVFDGILTMHKYRRKHVDLIRWQTGGDLLHPWTGVIWDEFVDLILDVAAFSRPRLCRLPTMLHTPLTSAGLLRTQCSSHWYRMPSRLSRSYRHRSPWYTAQSNLAVPSLALIVVYAVW